MEPAQPQSDEPEFQPVDGRPWTLEEMASLDEERFRMLFRPTPVSRAKYRGWLRNVAVAMGNSGSQRMRPALERLATLDDEMVAEHARWALDQIAGGE